MLQILNLNRMNDALFKNIFAHNSDITLSLINSVFEFQGTALITDIEFIDRNLDAEEDDGKESRLDLLGRSPDGTVINLEIQVAKQEYMGRRSLYYWSRLYNELKSGEEYTELKRTVTINILDFNLFEKKKYPNYHSCFGVYDLKTGNQLTSDCELHSLELPKWHLKTVKETNRLERWLSYFSKKTTLAELEEIAMLEPAIQKAFKAETIFTQDEINRRRYELREKNQRDRVAQINYAVKQAVTQAVTEEREKYAQKEEKRVISWIKKGKSFDEIMDFTSLTSDRVQQLFTETRGQESVQKENQKF